MPCEKWLVSIRAPGGRSGRGRARRRARQAAWERRSRLGPRWQAAWERSGHIDLPRGARPSEIRLRLRDRPRRPPASRELHVPGSGGRRHCVTGQSWRTGRPRQFPELGAPTIGEDLRLQLRQECARRRYGSRRQAAGRIFEVIVDGVMGVPSSSAICLELRCCQTRRKHVRCLSVRTATVRIGSASDPSSDIIGPPNLLHRGAFAGSG